MGNKTTDEKTGVVHVDSTGLLDAKNDVIAAARKLRHWHTAHKGDISRGGVFVSKLLRELKKHDELEKASNVNSEPR